MNLGARMRALVRLFDIRTYLKKYDPDAKDHGKEMSVDCPYCIEEDKLKKLWVLCEDRNGKRAGHWICYYCQSGGTDVVSLIRYIEDCSLFQVFEILTADRADAQHVDLRILIQDTLFGVDGSIEAHWDETPIKPIPLPDSFKRIRDVNQYPYLARRGISQERVDLYGLGVCTVGAGKEAKYTNRLIVPVILHGQQIFYIARYMKKIPPKGVKKSLYPVGAKSGRTLFNYDTAKQFERVYLVEDVFSAMAIGKRAMATFGTSFSQYQMDLLLRSAAQEVVIIWDRDDGAKAGQSGYEKAQKVAERLSEFWRVRNVRLPDARDPDEIKRSELRRLVKATSVLDESSAWRATVLSRL